MRPIDATEKIQLNMLSPFEYSWPLRTAAASCVNWAVNESGCGDAYRERDATLISPEVMFAVIVVTMLWSRSTIRLDASEKVLLYLS